MRLDCRHKTPHMRLSRSSFGNNRGAPTHPGYRIVLNRRVSVLYPQELTKEAFDEAAKSGKFAEHHAELFRNPLDTHAVGVMPDALQDIIKQGKLPLLEAETDGAWLALCACVVTSVRMRIATHRPTVCSWLNCHSSCTIKHAESTGRVLLSIAVTGVSANAAVHRCNWCHLARAGAEMLKKKGVDCLTVFLKPPSASEFEARLRKWLTVPEDAVRAMEAYAAEELAAAQNGKVAFDMVLPNGDASAAYFELKQLIRK